MVTCCGWTFGYTQAAELIAPLMAEAYFVLVAVIILTHPDGCQTCWSAFLPLRRMKA